MLNYVAIAFGVLAGVSVIVADDDGGQALKDFIHSSSEECFKEYSIDMAELVEAHKNKDFHSIPPCFAACIFKTNKLINDEGYFDNEHAMSVAEKFITSPEKLEKLGQITTSCLSVNDEKVSDSGKDCERAILLLKCFVDAKMRLVA